MNEYTNQGLHKDESNTESQPRATDSHLDDCFATNLRIVSRALTAIYDHELRPYGLRITQMSILDAIGSGSASTAAEISRVLILDRSTLSRTIERMLEKGWIAPAAAGRDGRFQPLVLTPGGRALLHQAEPGWKRAQRRTREIVGTDLLMAVHVARGQLAETLGVELSDHGSGDEDEPAQDRPDPLRPAPA